MKSLLRILKSASNLWPYYVVIILVSVVAALVNQVQPFIIKSVTDQVVLVLHGNSPNYMTGLWLAIVLFGSDVASTLLSNWGGYYGDIMAAKLKKQLSERYYEHLLKLPQNYYDKELTGTISNRLNRTIFELTNFMNFFSNNFFPMILTMIFTLVIVAHYSLEVAFLLFVIYPLFMWLTTVTSKKWQQQQSAKNLQTDIASGRFTEAISQIKVVRSFVQERRELRHLSHNYQQTVDITYQQSKLWHSMDIWRRLVLNVIFFIITAFIFWQTLKGRFTLGEMFLLLQFSLLMRIPLFSMSFIVDQVQHAMAGSKDYFAALDLQPAIVDAPDAKTLKVKTGELKYQDISFSYNQGESTLSNISFTIEPGSKVALVGESGGGKTTVTNLLLRLYEPDQGQILIDDTNIQDVTQYSLRKNIAVVFQDPSLFSGTISENIAYAKPDATKKAIIRAAQAANAHDFIEKLPKGYDTEIGERGVKLSGGQKQRIAIARALLKDAPILILDEATSSLDSKAEKLVQSALDTLMRGRTTLIIAHRLSTIAHVDNIITIKDGTIDEIGTPAELATTNGIYAELLNLQLNVTESAHKRLEKFDMVG
ncbi:MAG TPA: ABC transporter ATP-binding protein [Patescibacteria group bacterium]|jgi:ATP-binding cassette subfamily B protein|nr:ABC transporter ATP-binding protein [Patescibacteria group bacterium]